ncbi:bifunctional DNA primase/polymerase [Streptomyces meridianus]|uniref:Bifunctional DNA primase/polymerase n=1 Tax=Streptomyces meridianus TaxID=2938945 RepID=A0ABT0XAH3_9ACTN|nr:bifunctional DNA primase/polymerase [Streptomyces meridianus]MCM2579516.1 bifunctional DNA primase/polymerase [Streptomyces meridianus]
MDNTASDDAVTDAQDLRAAARELHDAGLCVLPIKADGTKRPAVAWMPYKVNRSTPDEHDTWFGGARPRGIAVVYGGVSGNVELIEFEGLAIAEGLLDEVTEIMQASGLGEEWKAILNGWVAESPSGGRHYRVRVEGGQVPGNTKLASRLAREEEYTPEDRQRIAEKPTAKIIRVLIETRGEGGYGLVEPSCGPVHASGKPYVRIAGGPGSIPTIDSEVMAAIREVCRMVDALPKQETTKTAPRAPQPLPGGGLRPGEDYEAKTDWADLLEPEGWTFVYQHGSTRYWRRPGKNRGVSATTGRASDRDRLYVFSTGTEFVSETPYNKFGAYALLHHGGDYKQAASALRRQGFGSEPPHRRVDVVPQQSGPFTDGSSALDPDVDPDVAPDVAPGEAPDFEAGPTLRVVEAARPELDITNEADAIDGLLAIMAAEQLPDLYKRSGGPCWVYEDDQGNPLVKQLAADNLRAYLADHVTTYQVVADPLTEGTKEVRELLMPKTCGTILGRKDWPLLPLRGIVTSPVVRPDGSLLQAPGYDKATGLYLQPRVKLRRLRPQVTNDALEKAKEIILGQMLADFPWKEPSDRAHFLGALLTPILRPYFYGTTPMFVFTATTMGSGKSLLKDIFLYLFGISETPWPENDTELRKSITTQLYTTGQPVVVLDNLPNGYVIKSPILSSLLTAEYWGDRVLGSTNSVTMPNDRLWIATGNGLRTGGDNGRRVVWVRLDPDCPNPDQRDGYKVGDLRPWLRANASTVVAALVTMVRGWLAAGAPTVRVRKGDYSEWASMLAGILKYLDVQGWMADRSDATEMDDETLEWSAFLTVWRSKLGGAPVTTGAVLGSVADHTPRQKNGELPSANVLGGWLKARDGRYFGTHKVVRVWDAHRCQNTWRVDVHQDRGTGRDES